MCYINEASYTAACILIISEILKSRDDIKYALFKQRKFESKSESKQAIKNAIDDDEDEERFIDIDRLDEQKDNTTKTNDNAP